MDREELVDYVRSQADGVVATVDEQGAPQAAYLTITATDQGELVFDARPASRKIVNLRRDPRIAVTVGGADGTTLQCQGRADLPVGTDLERCRDAYLAAFPQFEDSLRSGGVVVVRVALDWWRYGDYREPSGSRV
ncbi:MAG: pyridoxamine 5'-phosphate oxidase family protein [Cellulomonas sp.]